LCTVNDGKRIIYYQNLSFEIMLLSNMRFLIVSIQKGSAH